MLKIGDFSKLSRVPIATLRYYDERGLLKPVAIDEATGYRHYSISQLPRLNRILVLKGLGFTLDQIAQVLSEELSLEQLRGMLRLRRADIQHQVAIEQARLVEVEARLTQIEMENKPCEYDVRLKRVEPQRVASVRGLLRQFEEIGRLFEELYHSLPPGELDRPRGAICYDEEYVEQQVDAEALVFLENRVPELGKLKVYELPAATVVSVIHEGSYQTLSLAYRAALAWIDRNDFAIAGPARDLYLQPGLSGEAEASMPVTEVQLPIVKEGHR